MLWRSLVDDVTDVLLDLSARRGRAVLLMSAVALSTGALVTAVGVSLTASQQISADLAAQVLDEITVTAAAVSSGDVGGEVFTEDAQSRVQQISMVTAAGLRLDIDASVSAVSRFEPVDPSQQGRLDVETFGATSFYFDAVDATLPEGIGWMLDSSDPYDVAFVGTHAAKELGIPVDQNLTGYRIWVNGHPAEVVGIIGDGGRADLARAVVIPYAEAVTGQGDSQARMIVRTELGAGGNVAKVVRAAARPDAPDRLVATRIVDLQDLRTGVQSQLGRLAGTVGGLLLVLTGLLIANSMVVSVVSRTSEIGLRRALGASRAAVSRIFLLEGGLIGLLGGLAGSALGMWAVVAVAAANGWGATLSVWLGVAAPFLGMAIGIGASLYPSIRAARVGPATAIRVE